MKTPRILVIRGGAIGDFVLTLPAIALLRENFPSAEVEILGYQHILELARGRYYAHATRSIEYGPLAGFFARNATLDPQLVEYFAGFQQIVSYLFDPDGIFAQNLTRAGVKNFLPAFRRIADDDHAARQLARPLEQLALYLEDHAAHLHLSEEDHSAAAALLTGVTGHRLLAIHPGSGSAKKNWPVEHWAELGRRLAVKHEDLAFLLVGGEADQQPFAALQEAWRDLPVLPLQNLALPTLAAVLARSTLFLGHDSGISHIAAAAGARCTLLFGPTDPAVWAPANPAVQVLEALNGVLGELTLEEVQTNAETRLSQTDPEPR